MRGEIACKMVTSLHLAQSPHYMTHQPNSGRMRTIRRADGSHTRYRTKFNRFLWAGLFLAGFLFLCLVFADNFEELERSEMGTWIVLGISLFVAIVGALVGPSIPRLLR